MSDHPMGESAGMPAVASMSPAGALAHMLQFHDTRPPLYGPAADLTMIHREAHHDGRMRRQHGHLGTGWEMADLTTMARAAIEDASHPRRYVGDWMEPGVHAKVVAGFYSGRSGHIAAVRGNAVVLEDGYGEEFTTLRRDIASTGLPRKLDPETDRVMRAANSAEEKRLSGLPATMPEGEMLAHLFRLHRAHPASQTDRADLLRYHSRMHAEKRLAIGHAHVAPPARRTQVKLASGEDVTGLYEATAQLRESPRLMADEW